MKLKDYIFYRMSMAYRSTDKAVQFLSFIDFILFSPITLAFAVLGKRIGKYGPMIMIGLCLASIAWLNSRRYEKRKKIHELTRKYKNNKYNKIIKNWMIYPLPMIVMFLMIAIGKLIEKW